MYDWDGSSDQYKIDTDSVYPIFSDIQTNDYSLYNPLNTGVATPRQYIQEPQIRKMKPSTSRIEPFAASRTGPFADSRNGPFAASRTGPFADSRIGDAKQNCDCKNCRNKSPRIHMDVFVCLLIFIFIIVICSFYKSLIDIKMQLELLRELLKK